MIREELPSLEPPLCELSDVDTTGRTQECVCTDWEFLKAARLLVNDPFTIVEATL